MYMASGVFLLYFLFTVEFILNCQTGTSEVELEMFFIKEPRDVIGIRGKTIALPCEPRLSRRESFEIVWYHDNKQINITNDKRRTIFQNGTLYFSKLVHKRSGQSDQGEYRCVVVKENGSLSSKPGFLRISGLPGNFSRHPTAQNVVVGSNIRLFCEIDYIPEIKIEWEKNGIKLPQNFLKYATISGPDIGGSVLYIFNVVPDDSGRYRCAALNILLNKLRHSSSGLVSVSTSENPFKPRSLTFLTAEESFTSFLRQIKEGENVTLDCVTNGHPTPTLIWSYLPYGKNKSVSTFSTTHSGFNIVELKNITRFQEGWYKCRTVNFFNKEITIELNVMTVPKIQEKSNNIIFRASKTVRFRCAAYGNPIPDIFWLKDGANFNATGRVKHKTFINESLHIRFSELIVSSSIASDAGIYQCFAKNSVGSTWAASQLFLNATKPAPAAPEKVACQSLSSSQIKLTWDIPNVIGEVIAFSIHYHLSENGEEMQLVVPSNSRSIKIDKLLPFTNYTFYIRLYIDSASDFSEKVVCQTEEEGCPFPLEAPEVKIKNIKPNSVYISWIPLPKDKARGIVIQYKIQWRINKSPSSKVDLINSDVLDYIIPDMIPGKIYDVRVLAATNKGWPYIDLPWKTFEFPSNFDSKSSSDMGVLLHAINSSSIEITWHFGNKVTKVNGYKIFYHKINKNQLGPITVSANSNQYNISGLDSETWYEVMVLALTKEEAGESGKNSIYTPSLGESSKKSKLNYSSILEPPFSLEAAPVSSVAINLTWSPPRIFSENININYYTVCFNSVQTSYNKNTTLRCLRSSENKISVIGLKPYTFYEFKVKSQNANDKQSMFSQAVECQTLEGVPSQVTDINVKVLNKSTVEVTWNEPRQSNGIIKNYTLYFSQNSSLPLNLWGTKVVTPIIRRTELTGLTSNLKYYLIIRASTRAGFGTYGFPKQLLISSLKSLIAEGERITETIKSKRSNQYIGIIVGLGIGLCCIILCVISILCRRRCQKRQILQEFEATSSRYTNGIDCQRELGVESEETDYFTFFTLPKERSDITKNTEQFLDTKGHFPNRSANGLKLSLLIENKLSSVDCKKNIHITENFRYNSSYSKSPLLNSKVRSFTSKDGPGYTQESSLKNNVCNESQTTLFRNVSVADRCVIVTNSDIKEKKVLYNGPKLRLSSQYKKNLFVQHNIEFVQDDKKLSLKESKCTEKIKEDVAWLNEKSTVNNNSNGRFTKSNNFVKTIKSKYVFIQPQNCKSNINDNISNSEDCDTKNQICSIYKRTRFSLNLVSKEIL